MSDYEWNSSRIRGFLALLILLLLLAIPLVWLFCPPKRMPFM